jgi:hypothetical protein
VIDEHGEPSPDLLLAGLRDGAWLDGQVFPPLRYAVPGLIPEGSVLLVGPPKIGKSWFVLSASLAIAAGGQMLGVPVGDPRPVLLLALEDGDRRIQDRCRKLLDGEPIPKRFQYMTRVIPNLLTRMVAAWLDQHGEDAPLIILDTLGKVMPPAQVGESAYQRDYRVGSALKRVIDEHPGSTLLVNHHDRKAASEDFVDAVSGTHGLAGAADTILVLARKRTEDSGVLKVTGRDVLENEYALRLVGGTTWVLDGDDLTESANRAQVTRAIQNLGDEMGRVVAVVNANPGIRAAGVAEKTGLDAKTAGTYLGRAASAGRIERLGRGAYGPSWGGVGSVGSVGNSGFADPTLPTHPTGVADEPLWAGEDESDDREAWWQR